ncbi:TldD/PmbA family protein [Facilibium subflavum]|uniref:TldD/PmbA family protein n=1 Tax=Facilibium subflavum TaxID=2219058 RepID=UPI000E64B376|nr:metallopeptidase TldD-related protein [Facilibium subflavum]
MSIIHHIAHIKNVLQTACEIAKKAQVDAFEIHCSFDQGHVIDIRKQQTENLEFNASQSLSIQVYHQGKTGYAETSDLSHNGLHTTIEHAKTIAKFTEADPFSGIIDKDKLCTPKALAYLYRPWKHFRIEEVIDMAKTCEQHALDYSKEICSDGVEISCFEILYGFANSHGFLDVYPESRNSISIELIVEDKHGMQRDDAYFTHYDIQSLPTPKAIAQLAIDRTLSRRDPQSIQSQSMPVIFSPTTAKTLINGFLTALKGGKQYHKNTYLYNKLHQMVTKENISLIEDPNLKDGMGSQPYDDEGVNKARNPIVIDGMLQRYLLNSYSARQLQSETTGNAGGVSNIVIQSRNMMPEAQLIQTMDHGVIIHETMGQGLDITTGDYSQGAMGYYVKNGQIQYPVDNFTVSGNLADMFKNIQAISNDNIDKNTRIQTGSLLIDNCHIAGSQ